MKIVGTLFLCLLSMACQAYERLESPKVMNASYLRVYLEYEGQRYEEFSKLTYRISLEKDSDLNSELLAASRECSGHACIELEDVCSDLEKAFCMSSPGISFYLPRTLEKDAWQYQEATFQVLKKTCPEGSEDAFACKLQIKATHDDSNNVEIFTWGAEGGLLAMTLIRSDSISVYVAEHDQGLGAGLAN